MQAKTKINDMLNVPLYNSQITGLDNSNKQKSWAISFMKNRILVEWI